MKNTVILILAISSLSIHFTLHAQLWKRVEKSISGNTKNITSEEAVTGIKEALIKGTGKSVELVSLKDGYFGNPEIKIPFPPEADMIEDKLRLIGLGSEVDKVVLSINRAAEDAADEIKPIFISAIKKMSVHNALDIVNGSNHAATNYLQEKTTNDIIIKIEE